MSAHLIVVALLPTVGSFLIASSAQGAIRDRLRARRTLIGFTLVATAFLISAPLLLFAKGQFILAMLALLVGAAAGLSLSKLLRHS